MIRTLIIDDDFRVAELHAKFVNRVEGFHVVGSAHTAREARAVVSEKSPDLVLLDVYLPDGNGLELLHQWRAEQQPFGVIVITAAREVEAVRAALTGGVAHYLIKPFEYEELAEALARFRQQHAVVGAMASASQEEIDKIFAPARRHGDDQSLPKGLNAQTAQLVRQVLREKAELSASDCADLTGISRVSVRRYLEYFVRTGVATVRLEYGRPGRPTRFYRVK